jgi:hypothetical protein
MPAEHLHNRSRVIPFGFEMELRLRRRSDSEELAA